MSDLSDSAARCHQSGMASSARPGPGRRYHRPTTKAPGAPKPRVLRQALFAWVLDPPPATPTRLRSSPPPSTPEVPSQRPQSRAGGRRNRSYRPRPWASRPSVDQARCPRTHSGRRRPGTEPRTSYALVSGGYLDQQRRAVKPSAQPTLVRTQHLPPPAKTARSLRKRGPAGRFLLVPPCVIVCRCRASRSNRYGHIADSVRAEGAVRGTCGCRKLCHQAIFVDDATRAVLPLDPEMI